MATRNSTCAPVAKLVRAILRESFPNSTFSVRVQTYAFGQWLLIAWHDGPTENQVDRVTSIFTGLHYDADGNLHHCTAVTFQGVPLVGHLDRIIKHRGYTPALVEQAIDELYREHQQAFALHEISRPTYEAFLAGQLWQHKIAIPAENRFMSVHELLSGRLSRYTTVEVATSATFNQVHCIDTAQ